MEKQFKNDAATVLLGTISEFQGLIDGTSEVNGADLVNFLTAAIALMEKDSRQFAIIASDCMNSAKA